MDAFDGDSDLSDVSAPPTPGPAATPRAASPEAAPVEEVKTKTAASEASANSPQPSNKRRSSRRVAEAEAAALEPTTPAPLTSRKSNAASTSSVAETSDVAAEPSDTPISTRRASTRDRKATAKLKSPSPAVESGAKSSPTTKAGKDTEAALGATEKPKARLKVKLKGRSSADDSGSSRGTTPQPGSSATTASATTVTLKYGGRKKKRDLADEDDADRYAGDANHSVDDFAPDDQPTGSKDAADDERPVTGKRDRNIRSKAGGPRRAVVADDKEDEEAGEDDAPKPPQRKRAKLSDTGPAGSVKGKGRSARGGKKIVDYSDDADEDEEMVDAASDEEDLDDAAALDTDDEFDDEPSRSGKSTRKGKAGTDVTKKSGDWASAVAAKVSSSSATAGAKKAATASSSAPSSAPGSKAMSAEARMRASIDAAKDKSLKPPGVSSASSGTKLNPQASAFRPSNALKTGPGGASTPAGAGRPSTASTAGGSGAKRTPTGGKAAFGKSMSGWDQLFGGISGLSTSASSTPNKGTPTKPSAAGSKPGTPANAAPGAGAASSTGIRPDPVLEYASPAEVQRLKEQANQDHLNTDECFDLLAHADIMVAFERSLYAEDRKLATRLRPAFWKAGTILQQQQQQTQQKT